MGLTLSIKREERWHVFCFDRTKAVIPSVRLHLQRETRRGPQGVLFQMLWQRKNALLPSALGTALISVFHVNLISVDTWSLIVYLCYLWHWPQCVCYDYWYRERIWHLRKGSAPRLSAPPTPTAIAEIPTHAPAPRDELLTPLQNQNCRSAGINFCTQRFTCKHMFRCL